MLPHNVSIISPSDGLLEPFYFGPSDSQLYGCFHPPAPGAQRHCAVLLCYPLTQEYTRAHRNYRLLGLRLSAAGFPVLRFDYRGCGDSGGAFRDCRISHWLDDISCAVEELQSLTGMQKVCLMGLRLGGTLAMLSGEQQGSIDSLILWDAIVDGSHYMQHLVDTYENWLKFSDAKPNRKAKSRGMTEISGYPFSEHLVSDLQMVNVMSVKHMRAKHVLVLETTEDVGNGQTLASHFRHIGTSCQYQHIPGPAIWMGIANQGLVAHAAIESVVSWLSEVYP